MKKISIIIPVFNEASGLQKLRAALCPLIDNSLTDTPYGWEVIFINDGSRDTSLSIMQEIHAADPRFCYIDLSRNFGKENAMLAGLDHACGDAVVIMDADLQHPVRVIPQMIRQWEDDFQDVYGRRYERAGESFARKTLTRLYYYILQRSARIDILPDVGDFRLLDRACVNALRQLRETQRYSKGLFSWIGFSKKEVPFEVDERAAGRSSFSYAALFNLAIEGVTSFTTAPLRIASVVGILTAVCAIIYLLYILVRTMLYGDPVAGYPTIMCVMLFLGGCQLIALGIIGEYISRIFNECKRRPAYIINTVNGHAGDNHSML